MKKILFALVAAAALLVGCQPKPVLVSKITLSQTTGSVVEGETLKLSAIVTPKEASNPELTWSSSNTSAATVTGDGTVTGVAEGTATITAAATDGSNVKATCEITVSKKIIPVDAVGINEHAITLKKDETAQLVGVVTPATATDQTLTWASDNTDVATVDGTGKVTAKAAGTAKITATSNGDPTKKDECVVTVVEPKPMFARFQDMVIRVGQNYTNQEVWYGSVDNFADREKVTDATWKSDNESVVTAEPGSIKGMAPGKANVTITDATGSSITIPVEVLAAANKDYDYNYGIPLLDVKAYCTDEAIAANSQAKGLYSQATKFLGPGYAEGTQCYHAKDFTRGYNADGVTLKNTYMLFQARFDDVDITAIQNPALYIRLYVSNLSVLHLDGTTSEIELTSAFTADKEEIAWKGGSVFTNWDGHDANAKFTMKEGWNNIVLPLDITVPTGDPIRKKAINFIRMFCTPTVENNMSGKDLEIAVDQLRIVDWTEFDTCDNFDQWFDGGTGNNRPCFRAATNLDGHDKVFGSINELIDGPISNFRIKEWPGRVYALPTNMDTQNAVFSWWFWVDDADWFNKCHIKAELSSDNVNDKHNWAWGKNPGELHLKNGWNQITYDFKDAEDQTQGGDLPSKRNDRLINYFRIVVTPMTGAKSSVHTYYIDDLRISKK